MPLNIDATIDALDLLPHPEGGYYCETFRSPVTVETPRGTRAASTAIHFALRGGTYSAWHRVASDEVWHHYDGAPADLYTLVGDALVITRLGPDLSQGESPQAVVPAGVWQATHAPAGGCLFGCTVAPGFEFADFELATKALLAEHPAHARAIQRFLP